MGLGPHPTRAEGPTRLAAYALPGSDPRTEPRIHPPTLPPYKGEVDAELAQVEEESRAAEDAWQAEQRLAAMSGRAGTAALLLDEIFPPVIAEELRRCGHDVIAVAADTQLRAVTDSDLYAFAKREKRRVVTENVKDFRHLMMHSDELSRPGMLFTSSRTFSRSRRAPGETHRHPRLVTPGDSGGGVTANGMAETIRSRRVHVISMHCI